MVKLIALYRKPPDIEAFDSHYHGVHLPLVRKTPGLRKLEITKITGAPIGESRYHVMAEMYYDSLDAMNAANASPEGRAAAKDLMSSAAEFVTLFFGDIQG
ncbi:MAG: EthD family reductase [Ignavibacteria bacterium]|nr:MAG: EthD family reductase [Ignavibacteria bacterium]